VASSDKTWTALRRLARRTSDTLSKQSFRIRGSLTDSRGGEHHHRWVRGRKALLDSMSIEHSVRGYFVPLMVSVSIGFVAIADGLALPWSATITVRVGLSVHMA
jgi:hypothetical protein